ncbi:JmjC domain-containing protein [Achromobacter sp. Root83]|uniref:JmjC domain-containing protein n=1 Tax=Achromobacter sp. Root83 TaxID=1736602 RepID=UPI0009EC4218|nr:cupin domain-containing protein [Achromobacter sp. Root83]
MLTLGIDSKEFVASHYDKKPYFSSGGFTPTTAFSTETIESLLETWDSSAGTVAMYKDGRLPESYYSERYQDLNDIRIRLLPDRVRIYLEEGASLVLNRLERRSTYFAEICRELSEFANEKIVANGYLAFGGSGTFGRHWDTHDVFIVQLQGKKHWKIYEPSYELPLPKQRSTNYKSYCPCDPVIDRVLEEGDVLYLPRGWWHEAIPIPKQASFHIAAGIHTTKVVDYFEWLCLQILPQYVVFRRGLKVGAHDLNASIVREAAKAIADRLADPCCLTEYMEGIGSMRNRHLSSFIPY